MSDNTGEHSVDNPFDSADIAITAKAKPRFKLDDVISLKKPNDCPDCKTRVETYLKNVGEWQSAYDKLAAELDAVKAEFEQWKEDYPFDRHKIIAERDRLQAQLEEKDREITELKSKPPMFIKLDETTEEIQKTSAAIECIKQLQKDNQFLNRQLIVNSESWEKRFTQVNRALEAEREKVKAWVDHFHKIELILAEAVELENP